MEVLLIMDLKNYNDSLPRFRREAVRGIIISGKKIALVKSEKEGYFKFPGGGIENGETHEEALIRETKEETGLSVISSSIKAYGSVKEIRKSVYEDEIFEQTSYYYFCKAAENEISYTNLDKYEADLGYHLEYTTLEEAIKINSSFENKEGSEFIRRETEILRLLLNSQKKLALST